MKKEIIRIAFLVCLAVVCVASQTKSEPNKPTTYLDEKFPFSVMYPKGWVQSLDSQPLTRLAVSSNEPAGGMADFSVIVTTPKEVLGKSSKEFADSIAKRPNVMKGIIKLAFPDGELIESGYTYLSNYDAVYMKSNVTFRNLDDSYELTIYQIAMAFQGHQYTLTFRASRNEFESFFPVFKTIASSFIVRPKITPAMIEKLGADSELKLIKLDGFWGVKFGSSMANAKKVIFEKKNGKIDNRISNAESFFVDGANFGGRKAHMMILGFVNDKFHTASVLFMPDLEPKVFELYEQIKKEISDKYGKPQEDFKYFEKPYFFGDGSETQAIRLGKADIASYWVFERPDGFKNFLVLSISENLRVRLGYQDGKLIKESVEEVKQKNSKDF